MERFPYSPGSATPSHGSVWNAPDQSHSMNMLGPHGGTQRPCKLLTSCPCPLSRLLNSRRLTLPGMGRHLFWQQNDWRTGQEKRKPAGGVGGGTRAFFPESSSHECLSRQRTLWPRGGPAGVIPTAPPSTATVDSNNHNTEGDRGGGRAQFWEKGASARRNRDGKMNKGGDTEERGEGEKKRPPAINEGPTWQERGSV